MESNHAPGAEIEMARISLKSNGDALSAITNAVEVLLAIEPKPEGLYAQTIPRLMAHAAYLTDILKNDMDCFLGEVEETQKPSSIPRAMTNDTGVQEEPEGIIGNVLATLDCLFTLSATGDMGGMMSSSFETILGDSVVRLTKAYDMMTDSQFMQGGGTYRQIPVPGDEAAIPVKTDASTTPLNGALSEILDLAAENQAGQYSTGLKAFCNALGPILRNAAIAHEQVEALRSKCALLSASLAQAEKQLDMVVS